MFKFNKGYIGVTDRSWFEYIKTCKLTQEVNFWRKLKKKFNVLRMGEPFFFLVKNVNRTKGERHIEGFGFYQKFEVLTVTQAWEKYKYSNGVNDRDEFILQLKRLYLDVEENTTIGCIIISDIRFLEKPILLSHLNISFANSIVSGKGISGEDVEKIIKATNIV